MNRPLTDRERCLALEAKVAGLEEELAAYKHAEAAGLGAALDVERINRVRRLLRTANAGVGGAVPAAILLTLLDRPGATFSAYQLLQYRGPGCQHDYEPNDNVASVHITKIRQALRTLDLGDAIETVWGYGWRLRPDLVEPLKARLGL